MAPHGRSRTCTSRALARSCSGRTRPASSGERRNHLLRLAGVLRSRTILSPTSSSTRPRTSSTTASAPPLASVETRTKEWLLDIEYRKRETFAYSCEAYARVLERGKNPVERRALAEEYARTVRISDERVDAAEVASIVRAAAAGAERLEGHP